MACHRRSFTNWLQLLFQIYHTLFSLCLGHRNITVFSSPFTCCSLCHWLPPPENSANFYKPYKSSGEITCLRIILQFPLLHSQSTRFILYIALPFKIPFSHLPLPRMSFCIHIPRAGWSYSVSVKRMQELSNQLCPHPPLFSMLCCQRHVALTFSLIVTNPGKVLQTNISRGYQIYCLISCLLWTSI